MKLRIAIFILAICFGEMISGITSQVIDPAARTTLALIAVNSGNHEQRAYEQIRNHVRPALIASYAALAAILFAPAIAGALKNKNEN